MTKDEKRSFDRRVLLLQGFLCLVMALIVLRLFIISISQHGYYKALAEEQHSYFQELLPTRGEILITDKFSEKPYRAATNATKYMVYAVPREVKDPDMAAKKLSEILGIDKEDTYSKILNKEKYYVALMKNLTDEQYQKVLDAKIAGVNMDPESVRIYPEGEYLSQVLGFLGYDDNNPNKVGLYGLEKYYQKRLAGTPGSLSSEADLRGNWITGSKRDFVPAKDGESLLLTIDRSIQYKAETVIKESVIKHGAKGGSIIVADPKTGAILAMASYPTFNPNEYQKEKDPSVYSNAATLKSFEPGSTFKAITMAAGLDLKVVSPQTTYEDTGVIEQDGYKIRNSDNKANGIQTMVDVITKSLNTGVIFVEQKVGHQNFRKYVQDFGFGVPTEIELPESSGDLRNIKGKTDIQFYTASFGQGITVTPIQMVQAYIALANNGKMMQPYIVQAEIQPDGSQKVTEPKMVRQVISERTATLISGMLVDNVENGHGKKAGVKGYYIGGKTGTAQIVEDGKYVANANIGSFVGYGPIENPRFVIFVRVDHPRDVAYAETTAAPAFGQVAQFILDYYQIPTNRK